MLLQQFRSFYVRHFPNDMEHAIDMFSIFGGLGWEIDIDEPVEELLIKHILDNYGHLYNEISLLTLGDTHYHKLLSALAISDRRLPSAFKRAHLSSAKGGMAINYLEKSGILEIETSREEAPSKEYPKQKLKREVLRHRISPKMRFTAPFLRFWFYFVAPHAHQIEEGNYDGVLQRFTERYHSYTSLVFEELSNLFLIHLNQKDIIIDYGSYWDRQVEIDILAHTYNGRTIVGECKWTNHKINKKELTKLLEKCERTDIKADVIALFSKRGFSNELLSLKNEQLQLYSADDFERLVSNLTQDDLIKGFSRP